MVSVWLGSTMPSSRTVIVTGTVGLAGGDGDRRRYGELRRIRSW